MCKSEEEKKRGGKYQTNTRCFFGGHFIAEGRLKPVRKANIEDEIWKEI